MSSSRFTNWFLIDPVLIGLLVLGVHLSDVLARIACVYAVLIALASILIHRRDVRKATSYLSVCEAIGTNRLVTDDAADFALLHHEFANGRIHARYAPDLWTLVHAASGVAALSAFYLAGYAITAWIYLLSHYYCASDTALILRAVAVARRTTLLRKAA